MICVLKYTLIVSKLFCFTLQIDRYMSKTYVKVKDANKNNHETLVNFFNGYNPIAASCTLPNVTDIINIPFTENVLEGVAVYSKDRELVFHKKCGLSINRVVADMKKSLSKNVIFFISKKMGKDEKQLRIVL